VLGLLAFWNLPSAWPFKLQVYNVVSAHQRVDYYSAPTRASLGDLILNSNAANALCFPVGSDLGRDFDFYVDRSNIGHIPRYNDLSETCVSAFAQSAMGLSDTTGLLFFYDRCLEMAPGSVFRSTVMPGQLLGASVAAGAIGISDPEARAFRLECNLYAISDEGTVVRFDETTGLAIDSGVFGAATSSGVLPSALGGDFGIDRNLYIINCVSESEVERYSESKCFRTAHREHRSEPVSGPIAPVRVAPEWLNDETRVENFTASKADRLCVAIVSASVLWCLQSSFCASALAMGVSLWRHVDLLAMVSRAPNENAPDTHATPNSKD
jgi:hypothetical protein